MSDSKLITLVTWAMSGDFDFGVISRPHACVIKACYIIPLDNFVGGNRHC